MNKYVGHHNQILGVEEMRLVGGKGDGLRLFQVRNGKGLEFTVNADRCADIHRLSIGGVNCGFFSPCGWVAPAYYDKDGAFLDSFTAGFMTTCGLNNAGTDCEDNGEKLPTHGSITGVPAENIYHYIEGNEIHIKALIRDAALFKAKMLLEREYVVSLDKNELVMNDKLTNVGDAPAPLMMLYHCNMGYPLLSEYTEVKIPSVKVVGTSPRAEADIARCLTMEKPQACYKEQCFFHTLEGQAEISVYNPKLGKGLIMKYDTAELPRFCEWKMMGEYDYALGIEPGTTHPMGRPRCREAGFLITLEPGQVKEQSLKFEFIG